MNTKFVKLVEKECTRSLVLKGFKSPRIGTRFKELNDDFLGWVGLNKGNYSDHLQLNPFVGIHCIPIMKMVDELEGKKYKLGGTATYAIHMGEIAPDVKQYIFTENTNIDAEATRLAEEVDAHALSWMSQYTNYQALLEVIERKVDMLGGNPQWYAAGLYLNDQKQDAVEFVQSRTDLFNSQDQGRYSLYYRFAKPFLNMVAGNGN